MVSRYEIIIAAVVTIVALFATSCYICADDLSAESESVYLESDVNWKFRVEGNEAIITEVMASSSVSELVIPSAVYLETDTSKANPITVVGVDSFATLNYGFKGDVKSITIPSSVRYIELSAFEDFINLESVVFEDNSNLIHIGNKAFYNSGSANLPYDPTNEVITGSSRYPVIETPTVHYNGTNAFIANVLAGEGSRELYVKLDGVSSVDGDRKSVV